MTFANNQDNIGVIRRLAVDTDRRTVTDMGVDQATPQDRDERVSLAGPDPLEVLRALLKVDPEAPPADDEREQPASDPDA